MEKKEIELSPIEATAYFWVNTIKYKVREIVICGTGDKNEAKFAEIFYGYTERNWRKVYLELIKYIAKDVDHYIPKNHLDSFSQDTDINGHERLNDELSKITSQKIPDIRLVSNGGKDSVIYTTPSFVNIWHKSCGTTKLSTKYKPSYILTGDHKGLDFYNLLLSTIAVLKKENCNFKSVSILRKRFCKEYMKLSNSDENIDDITELFNSSFDKASFRGIIFGRSINEKYSSYFREIDFVELNDYMDLAHHYASVILQKGKDSNENSFCKTLKKNATVTKR